MRKALVLGFAVAMLATTALTAQNERAKSPAGKAATQIGDHWIDIEYSRPILRGRTAIFGSGEEYGKKVTGGAPVWRLGANQSTRLKTEVALKFGDTTVPAGEYSLFARLDGPDSWTLIISSWGHQKDYSPEDKENLWGAYGYTADKDVARFKMDVQPAQVSLDQFTIIFANVTDAGGVIAMGWENSVALAPFMVAK